MVDTDIRARHWTGIHAMLAGSDRTALVWNVIEFIVLSNIWYYDTKDVRAIPNILHGAANKNQTIAVDAKR